MKGTARGPNTPATRPRYDWAAIVAAAKDARGGWILALRDVPAGALRQIRQRRSRELRNLGGTLEGTLVNEYRDGDRCRRGDIYVRFIINQGDPT